MLGKSPNQITPQTDLFRPLLGSFINLNDPLVILGTKIKWDEIEANLSDLYAKNGAPSKPIRLMVGLLMLKSMFNRSDEVIVEDWKSNPYYQYFTGGVYFEWVQPCDASELVHFRNRIGETGVRDILSLSHDLHKDKIQKATELIVDTTVQEKNITFPTDAKLTNKIIEKTVKFSKKNKLKLKQTFSKEIKELKVMLRFSNHPKKKKEARKALKRLKTIASKLIRDTAKKAKEIGILESFLPNKELFEKVLAQSRHSKNKIYSLHEPQTSCIAKGKAHKPYEFGCKISLAMLPGSNVLLGVSHFTGNPNDSTTLIPTIQQIPNMPPNITHIIVDRGYRGNKKVEDIKVVIPNPKADQTLNVKQKQIKSRQCKRRAAIEPIISHVKHECRMIRNFLKGLKGDIFNAVMAVAAFNLRQAFNEIKENVFLWLQVILNHNRFFTNFSPNILNPNPNLTF